MFPQFWAIINKLWIIFQLQVSIFGSESWFPQLFNLINWLFCIKGFRTIISWKIVQICFWRKSRPWEYIKFMKSNNALLWLVGRRIGPWNRANSELFEVDEEDEIVRIRLQGLPIMLVLAKSSFITSAANHKLNAVYHRLCWLFSLLTRYLDEPR